ncbi:MAG: thioredoxin-dependent thiol peroxidase [Spirochaetaceae bacterium]|nr:thioredoxin-dependent thiol peroxidase [Spirochaetaceae bacterium]
MLKKGDPAPDFLLADADGVTHGLGEFAGGKLVLYFYPKDETSGCTTEACGFRDAHDEIRAKGAAVVGVSADSQAAHRKFAEKHGLPFLLLSDPERKAIEAYGAWGEKKLYGKAYLGILRSTFLIDEKGMIERVFPKVSPATHAAEILEALS